jgi:AcrR family transcriptional regulator
MATVSFFPQLANSDEHDLSAFWLNFGENPEPSIKQKMIYLTIREVAIVGPGSFNTMGVCDTLGVTYPMVNHYFGNRDGLLAEAGFATYKLYIDRIWESVQAAKVDPETRLRAWMEAQVRLNSEISGWGAILNYSPFSQTVFQIIEEKFGESRKQLFELNISRLAQLIKDYRDNRLTQFDFDVDNYPRAEFMADQKLVELTSTIAFSTLGLAVWKSGGHAPSQGIADLKKIEDPLAEAHIKNMLALVRSA